MNSPYSWFTMSCTKQVSNPHKIGKKSNKKKEQLNNVKLLLTLIT